MITPRLVIVLGISQLVCWGISYYLIGAFGEAIAGEFGWSRTLTHGGFSAALLVMAFTSGLVGRLIDQHGGQRVMTGGSILLAVGCLGLSQSSGLVSYGAWWICLGLGMRMTLYEAAFATLAHIGGGSARRAISQVTLAGGLASTVFWPIGHALLDAFGWRGALVAYALIALATIPLHWSIPQGRHRPPTEAGRPPPEPLASSRQDRIVAGSLYATIVTIASVLNAGMSAHMIGIIAGLGASAAIAVWLSTLRGIGQSAARLGEVLFGARINPLTLGVLAAALLPVAFLTGLLSGQFVIAGALFALLYGAGNGLLTIVRGTQPLILFDTRSYGAIAGRLTAPSFFLSALAPVAYAGVIDAMGYAAALILSAVLGAIVIASATLLHRQFRPRG